MGILAELTILEKLDGLFLWINFRFNIRTNRREAVKTLGARPLTFAALDIPVTYILLRRVTKNVTASRLR